MGLKKPTYEVTEKPVREAQDMGDHRGQIAPGTHKGQEVLQPTRSKKVELPSQAEGMKNKEHKLPEIDAKPSVGGTTTTWDQERDMKLMKGSKK